MKFKKLVASVGVLSLLGIVGCSSSHKVEDNLLRCNATSNGGMVETEEGYFILYDKFLYYADKSDLNTWVPVCNKPDCEHTDIKCKANINGRQIIQNTDGKLYSFTSDVYGTYIGPHIIEVSPDGSGVIAQYEIDFACNATEELYAYRAEMSQEQMIVYYGYFSEKGTFEERLARLEGGTLHHLYSKSHDAENSSLLMGAKTYWGMYGEDAYCCAALNEEGEGLFDIIWNLDGDEPKRLSALDDIYKLGGYLSEETFTYFKENEGFYERNLETGEEQLICENKLENSRGYVLTEDYMIECNRHSGYTLEEDAVLKFYNGEGWYNVKLPEELNDLEKSIQVLSVASDRIFIKQHQFVNNQNYNRIYYFMLEDDEPELVYCGEFGEPEESASSEQSTEEESNFEEIVVFDTKEYYLEISNVIADKDGYKIDFYWENRSEKQLSFNLRNAAIAINGLQPQSFCWWKDTGPGTTSESQEQKYNRLDLAKSFVDKYSLLSGIYTTDDFTDIELRFTVENEDHDELDSNIIHIYPQGEENAIEYVREPQEADVVIVDNENLTIIMIGYEEINIPNDKIKFFVKNKTDNVIGSIESEDDWLVNGIPIGNQSLGISELFPGQGVMTSVFLSPEELNGITNIEEIKCNIHLYPKEFFSQEVTLYP